MKVVHTKQELSIALTELATRDLALVPTMGFLHEGHLELIKKANAVSDSKCIVSIFVNASQFNDPNDFKNYPRDIERDLSLCEKEKVALVFAPSHEEMYPKPLQIKLSLPSLSQNLCGRTRPGHFEGVLSIVLRLLHLCNPKWALFGKKDYQQYFLINKMVEELDVPTKIIGVETLRDENGLALSSRNVRLSMEARKHALLIPRALKLANQALRENSPSLYDLIEITKDVILSGSLNQIDYIELVDAETLEVPLEIKKGSGKNYLLAVGVFCDGVRLIDNLEIKI